MGSTISDWLPGRMHDDETFDKDPFDRSRARRADDVGVCPGPCTDALGADAGHGLWLRQGGQDLFLQDGHQQCGPAAEGREEGAEGHLVLHRPERTALYADRSLPRGQRQVPVRPGVSYTTALFLPSPGGGGSLAQRAGWGEPRKMVSTSIRRAAANKLRANTTPHERILWRALKELPVDGTHFRRQAPIGPYVVDFFCPAKPLIIELDGGHHNDDENAKRDQERQLWLEREGYRVIRFWNSEITNDLNAVLERIFVELYGSREAKVGLLKHRRRPRKLHPTPPAMQATLPLQGRVKT